MPPAEIIYLSGITLAILTPVARSRLFDRLAGLRETGRTKIAFDSNFRPALWEDAATARATMERMWALTDIALPSMDDEMAISGVDTESAVINRFGGRSWDGVAIKRGVRGPVSPFIAESDMPDFPPATAVVDTTAAGDSFNAAYLAAFLNGATEIERHRAGHRLAARVVGAPGAIMPRDSGSSCGSRRSRTAARLAVCNAGILLKLSRPLVNNPDNDAAASAHSRRQAVVSTGPARRRSAYEIPHGR